MKSSNIRILVVLAIITLIGIVSTQIYWVNRAIDQQDQVFSHNVQVALRNVVESLCEANGKEIPTGNPIEQVSGNYFIVRTNDRIDLKTLEYLITAEVQERSITDDFEYGVYDCQNDQMVYADNVNLVSVEHKDFFPELKEEEYYFGVYFPSKSKTIIGGLDLWKFTTGLTIVVLLFFGYGLFLIFKQKRLSEIQKDFINNVTHELKTPLATLSLATGTLEERFPKEGSKYIEIINQETQRLEHHVEKILKGAMLDDKSEIQTERIQLDEFLNTLIDRCKQQYQRNMIEWHLECDAAQISTDTNLLDNILSNLIDNAIKYGGAKIEVVVKTIRNSIEISVRDNGIGIADDQQKRIFNKFYRIPESKDQHNVKGFGLGLYIVKKSIQKLKGKLDLESVVGEGSKFTITLPNG
ncbi:MAG: HAMP domain-containing sensor histidine kinase [Cyclobacteriaceae bacterium]